MDAGAGDPGAEAGAVLADHVAITDPVYEEWTWLSWSTSSPMHSLRLLSSPAFNGLRRSEAETQWGERW